MSSHTVQGTSKVKIQSSALDRSSIAYPSIRSAHERRSISANYSLRADLNPLLEENAGSIEGKDSGRGQSPFVQVIEQKLGSSLKVNALYPKYHRAKISVWHDLTVDTIDRLNESHNPEHVKHVLSGVFDMANYKTDLKNGILMDLYYYTLQFAWSQDFNREKTSTFFSIIKKIFEVCVETPFGNMEHVFQYFRDLLLCHSVNRPPYSIELFSTDEVRKITEYTINTFFRHFKMYKFAFTPVVRLDLAIDYAGIPIETEASNEDSADKSADSEDDKLKEEDADHQDDAEQQAKEEIKNMVKTFLQAESKNIEGSVDKQLKTAVENLNKEIDRMTTKKK